MAQRSREPAESRLGLALWVRRAHAEVPVRARRAGAAERGHVALRLSGHVALRLSGHVALRLSGHVALRLSGHVALRLSRQVALRLSGHVALRLSGWELCRGWLQLFGCLQEVFLIGSVLAADLDRDEHDDHVDDHADPAKRGDQADVLAEGGAGSEEHCWSLPTEDASVS